MGFPKAGMSFRINKSLKRRRRAGSRNVIDNKGFEKHASQKKETREGSFWQRGGEQPAPAGAAARLCFSSVEEEWKGGESDAGFGANAGRRFYGAEAGKAEPVDVCLRDIVTASILAAFSERRKRPGARAARNCPA